MKTKCLYEVRMNAHVLDLTRALKKKEKERENEILFPSDRMDMKRFETGVGFGSGFESGRDTCSIS